MAQKVTHASPPDGIDLSTVDRTIASGFRLLKFPRRLETAFEGETGPQRCRNLTMGAFFGIAIYDLFLIADWWVMPDIFATALWLRLALVTPLALIMTMAFYLRPPVFLREFLAVAGTMLAAGTQLYLMVLSRSLVQDSQHQTVVLIILYLTMVQRVRFWYAVPACLVCFALHAAALELLPVYAFELKVSANTFFGCVVVFALIASYALEHELRLAYLFSLRGRLQNHELDAISRRDALTGLGNRRSLDEALAQCERRPCEELAVALFDIDHFKLFNDALGHQAGDNCLKRIALIVQGELRDRADCVFRFGGEEFLVMLRATDLPTGLAIAERLRRAIEEAAIPNPALPGEAFVTASFGVASAPLGGEIGAAEIIAGADAALYGAKRNGRNQVWPRFPSTRRAEIAGVAERISRAS
jgi:diguanylate cyclase (GGDEF)-like protein